MSEPLHETQLVQEFRDRGVTVERKWDDRKRQVVLVARPASAVTAEMALTMRRVKFAILGALDGIEGPVTIDVCDRCRWQFVVPPIKRCEPCVVLHERHAGRWFEIRPNSEAERVLLAELDRRAQAVAPQARTTTSTTNPETETVGAL